MWSPQRQDGDTKIIGPAYTVKYSLNEDPAPKHPTHYVSSPSLINRNVLITRNLQIDSVPEGAVIFVSCPPKVSNAVYGGIMSTRAKYSKARGTIVDGRFRDLDEQRALNYPVSKIIFPYEMTRKRLTIKGLCP